MDVSTIIGLSRDQTNTTTGQADDNKMLGWLNLVQEEIFTKLGSTDKKYTWDIYTDNTVAYQNEYTIPREILTGDSPHERMKRLLKAYIKYKNDFVRIKIYNDLPFPVVDYRDYNNPVALIADGSLFVYPGPYADKVDAIRFEGTYMPYELKLTDEEGDIKLAREYHNLYVLGLNKYAFSYKQLFDKAQYMTSEFDRELTRMLGDGAREIQDAYTETLPDLSYFE